MKDGTIDVIATDHAPHHYDEKEREFADAPNGIVGLETALAVSHHVARAAGHHRLADAGRADVVRAGAGRSSCPAARCGEGALADVTVFDPDAEWTVDPARFASKGRNTPYAGQALRGLVDLYHGRRTRRPSASRVARTCRGRSLADARSSASAGGCTSAG